MNLDKQIDNFIISNRATELVKATKIALLVGISGAGKDTIKRALLETQQFGEIVSHTTRLPRKNHGIDEVDGKDYYFISEKNAQEMLSMHEFIEVKHVHGNIYGTTIGALEKAASQGVAITDIDVQGVKEYKKISSDVIALFILPPSYEVWLQRLRSRYASDDEFQAEWPKRRASAVSELTQALETPYYHCIINDDISRATRVCAEIIERGDTFGRKDDEARILARDLLDEIQNQPAQPGTH